MITPNISTETYESNAIELRHRLHSIPELAFQEIQTAKVIRDELDRQGIAYIAGVSGAPTATICMVGDLNKPCIALRADIDGLPIAEKTNLAYSSIHAGKMHACGHDGHTAILLGAGAVLKALQEELPVCVKLIWQPAEEEGGGADRLIEAGVLDGRVGPRVRAIFGLHGWPGLPVGRVATAAGPVLASTDSFRATFIGRGCHGAYPHLGTDPILPACEAVLNLQQFVSRELDPTDAGVVTVGLIRGGTAINIIPDQATIEGTVRTLNDNARRLAKAAISRRCTAMAAAGQCTAKIDWMEGYPATVNHIGMADFVAKVVHGVLGPNQFVTVAKPSMAGEDFAYYLRKIPGCFSFIGLQPAGRPEYTSLHTDHFNFCDAAIGIGIKFFLGLAMNFSDV